MKRLRHLVIRNKAEKATSKSFSIPLTHNSLVVFSVADNAKYQHKIVLAPSDEPVSARAFAESEKDKWLGFTWRQSKTFITFHGNVPLLADKRPLTLATSDQRHELYKYRKLENTTTGFVYPKLDFTLSPGDLLTPISH